MENGGSGGGASMWAYIHLIASELTDDAALKKQYKDDALKALRHANTLDYFEMRGIRTTTKTTSIAWNVRANLLAQRLTGGKEYLQHAQKTVKSLLSFYYLNTNPYAFFPSYGFSYADLRERWEAYLEMSSSLWIISEVMEYMRNDTTLLDVMYSASKCHIYAYPVNGKPHGNQERVNPSYDSHDAYFIPYEFPTGVLVDNPGTDGAAQTSIRQIKELYGSGVTFLEYLMFEAWGVSADPTQLVLCLTASRNDPGNTDHKFLIYNPVSADKKASYRFRNLAEGSYEVKIDGQKAGVFGAAQLDGGLSIALGAKKSALVSVRKV
jgi:hypothetical protein